MKLSRLVILIMAAAVCINGCHAAHEHGHDHEHEHEHEHAHEHEHEHAHDHEHEHEHEHEGEHEGEHPGEIAFSEAKQAIFGIQTEEVTPGVFCAVIKTSGEILPAQGDEQTIVATAPGVIHFSGKVPSEGNSIGKNSAFAVINTQSADGGDPVSKARAAYETAKKEFERDELLLKDNIISVSHYDQSKLSYEQAKAAYEALTRSGYNENGMKVVSPLDGYFKTVFVSEGQYVNVGDAIATVSQNRRLQLRAEVTERHYSELSAIRDANFVTADGEVFSVSGLGGKVLSYGRNSSKFYIPVTFEFNNKAGVVPGTFVEVYLKAAQESSAITIPVEAVIEEQGAYSVFVQHEDDAFLKREVKLGQSDGVRVKVLSGLEEGEKVVVKGAIQIKLASVSAVPAGHNHNH